jgi:exonuclease VII small subunit
MARLAHFFIQAAGLAVVLVLWTRTFLRSGFSSDLWLVLVILPPWVLSSYLIRKGMSAFRWTESLGRTLGCSVDSYFLVTAIGLASGDSAIVARAFFVFLFVVALLGGPTTILVVVATGTLAYYAVLLGDTSALGLKEIVVAGLLGGICGMAWKLVVPLLWKAVNLLVAEPKPAAPAKSAEEAELEALAAAGFGRPAPASTAEAPAAVALPFTQPGGGPATSGTGLPFLNGGPVTAAPGETMADPEALRLVLRDRETALLAVQSEKDALAAEVEKLRGQLQASTAPPGEGGAAAADDRVRALEAELAQARTAQQAAEKTAEKLRSDLAAAEQEMAKLYGLDGPPPAAAPGEGGAAAPDDRVRALEAELAQARTAQQAAEKTAEKLRSDLAAAEQEMAKLFGMDTPAPASSQPAAAAGKP